MLKNDKGKSVYQFRKVISQSCSIWKRNVHNLPLIFLQISLCIRSQSLFSTMDPYSPIQVRQNPTPIPTYPISYHEASPPRTHSRSAASLNNPQPNPPCDDVPQIPANARSASEDKRYLDGIGMRLRPLRKA